MNKNEIGTIASNLTVAFYSAVERMPAYLGEDRRHAAKPPAGLDMRNPAISPDDVFNVYHRFVKMLEHSDKQP
jgi:hypothetical protein